MIRIIAIFIHAALLLGGGVILLVFSARKNNPKWKKRAVFLFIMGGLFTAGNFIQIFIEGTYGYTIEFLIHFNATVFFIISFAKTRTKKEKIKEPKKNRKKRIYVIVGICLGIGLIFALNAPLKALYRTIAKNVKPITYSDKMARTILLNGFYKFKVPGFDYSDVEEVEFYSGVTQSNRHALVCVPYDYDPSKKYPVIYLLHGIGGDLYNWYHKNAEIIIQNMHYLYDCPEMITVFVSSDVNREESTKGLNFREKSVYFDKTEEELVNYLMPYVNSHYSVYTDKEHTAIAGNSMGGRNAMYIGFTHQDLFGHIGAFSSAGMINKTNEFYNAKEKSFKIDERYGGFKTLLITTGREDFICGNVSYEMDRNLTKAGIEHIFYDTIGTHQNLVWQNALYNFCMAMKG